jgi:alkylation response protein AidB-like acyl-CoA dehydrogenase
MNFNLSDEQKQLADAIRRFVEKSYDFESRKKNIKTDAGYGEQAWGALVELGLTALPVPEAQGGFSGTAVDMMVVQEQLGRGLVVEPYFATVVAAHALKLAGGQEALLEQVAGGEVKLATAFNEAQARYELNDVTVTAKGGKLNGRKVVAIHGAQADKLVVSARTGGAQSDRDGISLFLVDTKGAGVNVKDYRTIDNLRAADVTFADAPATLLGAEGVGVMDTLNAATLEYAKTRQQFGVPIARFQALQHRMVEMFIHAEQSRSITLLAAARFEEATPEERRRYVSAAKARVGQAARSVGQEAVQIHGGMGVTDELPAAHMFKRLTLINTTFGDVDHHLGRFASQASFQEAA